MQASVAAGNVALVPTYRALRTAQYLYVEWYAGEEHEYELYDVVNDPYQLDNIAAQNPGLVAYLQPRLTALSSCAGQSCRT